MMAVLPDPVVAPVAVAFDSDEHALTVWPVETRSQAGRLWDDGIEELAEAEETGNWDYATPVWGVVGNRRVARGVPAPESGVLTFRFRRGDPVYRELATTPRLSGAVVVDRSRAQLMYVRFHGQRR
jgi:hypothetical protein